MGDLLDDQARFIAVLQKGPSALPECLFSDPPDRVLLGLRAHANTISHARLVALEETYPRTREHLGEAEFNALSRTFIERPDVRRRKLMGLGQGLAEFLADQTHDAAAVDLARIEWAWLQSYHSAEAQALQLADLAGLDEQGLLDLGLALHPSTRIVETRTALGPLMPELSESAAPEMRHLLITRPAHEVLLHPLAPLSANLVMQTQFPAPMGNLLARAIERAGEAEALPAIFALVGAGALVRSQE
jgi:hypothetical protein